MSARSPEIGRKIASCIAIGLCGIMVFFLVVCLQGYESGKAIYISAQDKSVESASAVVTRLLEDSSGHGPYVVEYRYNDGTTERPGIAAVNDS